jgi:hypothetical protein
VPGPSPGPEVGRLRCEAARPFGMIVWVADFGRADGSDRELSVAFVRGRWLAAGAVVVAAVAVAIALAVRPGASGSGSAPVLFRLSAAPLGGNVAPWDGVYTGSGAAVLQPLLSAAGIRQLRYGGGSYADYYDWQANANLGNCLPDNTRASFTSGCASTDPLDFGQFSRQARAIGAESFVTVNYGSGTPALAAAWVRAARTSGRQVALWEVGNETYGCYEVDNELAGAPVHYQGYRPAVASAAGQYQTCPQTTEGPAAGTQTLATSYAANALRFLRAMRQADPSAVIGVPWAFGDSVAGAAVPDNGEWNSTVLGTDGADIGFVDAHYYPFSFAGSAGGSNPSDAQLLQALRAIPSLESSIRAGLAAHAPRAGVVIGETAPSSQPTTTVCTPAGAVFAAGDALSWLAAGARSVDWWDVNNYGNTGSSCAKPDFGLFSSGATPVPYTSYYGYLLAAKLAVPGARLGFLATSDPAEVLAYQSVLPGGGHAVAFLNLDPGGAHTVTFAAPSGLTGTLHSLTYSAGTQNADQSQIVTGTTTASPTVTLPAESVTVLSTR